MTTPPSLREKVARAIKTASHDPWSKGGVADDMWPVMAAAAIRAVREHLESKPALERAIRRWTWPSNPEHSTDNITVSEWDDMRAALRAAVGDA